MHHRILTGLLAATVLAQAAPRIDVLETRVISQEAQYYHGWPTLAQRRDGTLLLAYSGGRAAHICPFGRVELMVSHDQGATWSWPQVLSDSPIDDRDCGVLETAQGTLLVSTFTSLAYEERLLAAARKKKPGDPGAWPAAKLQLWEATHNRVGAEQRQAALGMWLLRSADGGATWSPPYASPVNSPHGPVQLRDGRLLYAGQELWAKVKRVGVCESVDDGRTWRWLAEIPARPGESCADYFELHAVEAASGRLVVQLRNHSATDHFETLQTESADGGRTWSVPHAIGVWGLPAHLLRLRDHRLLMTYGYRRPPFGNQARVSADEGRTWSAPLPISADGASGDLGYPSTVELADGTLLTVWYELPRDSTKAVLRQARWRLD